MNQVISFKKNIFGKISIKPFAIKYEITNSVQNLLLFKNDLLEILSKFGNYKSREVILLHKDALPPKTKRCAMEIMSIDKSITNSTNYFDNYDKENIILKIILNFKKDKMALYIKYINSLLKFMELTKNKKQDIKILIKNKNEYPQWIIDYFEENNLKKMNTIKFIVAIQNYYKKMFLPISEIKLKGKLILSFSSKETRNEYLQKNDIALDSKNKLILNDNTIIINSKYVKNFNNVISFAKNNQINLVKNIVTQINQLSNLEEVLQNAPVIGILDESISQTSPFRNLINVTSYLNNHIPSGHGEAVSSIAYAGDKLNNFDDGCNNFNVHLFEVFEDGISEDEIVRRIEMAIKSKHDEIKIWNFSINIMFEDAFSNGKITWMATQLDRIQKKYNVLIIQSSGNKSENNFSKKILAPSDSIKSLVVNAISSKKNNKHADYSLDGHYEFFTRKPDLAYFGGSKNEPVFFLKDGKIASSYGTSYAAPFVARKMAQLVYYENKTILEAKALIIHASYMNEDSNSIKNGWGVVPHNINDILNTNDHSIRFVFNENISDTKTAFMKLKIPQNDVQKYSVYITWLCSEKFDAKFGCEYLRSSVNMNAGPINKDNKLVPWRKVNPHKVETSEGEVLAREKELIKFYGKWKSINCAKDVLSRTRKGISTKTYGFFTKIDKRMNVINKVINHEFVCVVTLVNKDKQDKYNAFILENKNFIVNPIKSRFTGRIKLKK